MADQRVIFKYPLLADEASPMLAMAEMPEDAQILDIQYQIVPREIGQAEDGTTVIAMAPSPVIWAIVDPNAPTRPRNFWVIPTGQPFPADAALGPHLGTLSIPGSVDHVFDVAPVDLSGLGGFASTTPLN